MQSSMTVRRQLITLALAVLLPAVAAAVATIAYVYKEERERFASSMAESTRALSLVVDREIAKREAVLKTLARAPSLMRGDLQAFHEYARQIAPTLEATVVLSDVNGQQLINTRRPFGEPLPMTVFGPLRVAAGPTATVVSDLYFAPFGKQHSFAVEVPVVISGRVAYYLAMGSFSSHLHDVLADQSLSEGWVATIVDRRGAVVARSLNHDESVGKLAPSEQIKRAEDAHRGLVRLQTLEGGHVLGTFERAPYGWGFFIGVSERKVVSPLDVALGFGGAVLVVMLLALWVVLFLARRLVRPIEQLAQQAAALGRGDAVAAQPSGLAEADRVGAALAQASLALRGENERMQQKVDEALADAEKAHRAMVRNQRLEAVGQLTGGVAHDFNNLLMVVNTNLHLLRHAHPELRETPQVARIERAVATGTKLTRQLLAFSRRQPIRPEVVQLREVLPELMELMRPTLSSTVQITCTVQPDLAPVRIDPAEFELALINLAVNARDAMAGKGQLSVTARNAPAGEQLPDQDAVVIEVSDSGSGIPPELIDKVFEPFFTTKEVGRGTGLGLSQVYGMATQAGGTVRLESRVGEGTTVRLVLPAASEPVTRHDDGTLPGAVRSLDCSVLLVEDNRELAQVTRELLAQAGCKVEHASSALEALDVLGRGPLPQVVLSDIRMPGEMDGIALAARLREAHPGLPVVLMTGYTAEMEAARKLQLDVLSKPVQPAQLLETLAAVCGADASGVKPRSGGTSRPAAAGAA